VRAPIELVWMRQIGCITYNCTDFWFRTALQTPQKSRKQKKNAIPHPHNKGYTYGCTVSEFWETMRLLWQSVCIFRQSVGLFWQTIRKRTFCFRLSHCDFWRKWNCFRVGFLATCVLPGAIGLSMLRTSVKPRYIPPSDSPDPELVLLSSTFFLPERNRSLVLRHFNFKKSNSLDSGKGWSALYHPRGSGVGIPPPRP